MLILLIQNNKMKESLKLLYEFVRFFVISIPVFLVVCLLAMVIVVIKQIVIKLKHYFKLIIPISS
jgi:hypothetical protein